MFNTVKTNIRAMGLQALGLKFLHITGCARSGTTLLFYVMAAFKKTYLYDHETNIWSHPNLNELKELKKNIFWPNIIYVTKRPAKWYQEPWLPKTINFVKKFKSRLIYIMRDPRSVLTSRHPLDKNQYYVSPEKWLSSMRGYYKMKQNLSGYPGFIIIRYEDLIQNDEKIIEQFKTSLQLELDDKVQSIARLKTYIENSHLKNQHMIQFMHNLRDFDPTSLKRWENNPQDLEYLEKLFSEKSINSELQKVMSEFSYH